MPAGVLQRGFRQRVARVRPARLDARDDLLQAGEDALRLALAPGLRRLGLDGPDVAVDRRRVLAPLAGRNVGEFEETSFVRGRSKEPR